MSIPRISAEEAAAHINDGDSVAFSGFTPAGSPKVVSQAIAAKAEHEHRAGRNFKIGVITGASTGPSLDGALAQADAVSFRTPYQSDPAMRRSINNGQTRFFDMHLSMVAQNARYGFLGPVDYAVIEACDIDEQGNVVLTTGVGCAPTWAMLADKVFIELNRFHPASLRGMHDIYQPLDPPHRREIPLYGVKDRIGEEVVRIPPEKIIGIIEHEMDDETGAFRPCDATTLKIGDNVACFLAGEMAAGRIPKDFLPLQSGVGETANAVLEALSAHEDIPAYTMYTEVIQDAVIEQIKSGRISFASGSSLTISPEVRQELYQSLDFYKDKLILRPQEITNHPELIRRLGLISCNTAIEVDIFGNVNSTHVLGKKMMNGIGGSGDFTRNAYISMFICPSTQKGNKISTIVPQVSHADHSEHSVQVVATEWGVADLRGRAPMERARLIIERCAHPEFRDLLREYLARGGNTHTPGDMAKAYSLHEAFSLSGDMHQVNLSK